MGTDKNIKLHIVTDIKMRSDTMPLKTEYQLHFGCEKSEAEKENYLSRLSFRKDRISHEHRHTPLIWADIDVKMDTTESIKENTENDTVIIESSDKNCDKPGVSEKTDEVGPNSIVSEEEDKPTVVLLADHDTQAPSKLDVKVK